MSCSSVTSKPWKLDWPQGRESPASRPADQRYTIRENPAMVTNLQNDCESSRIDHISLSPRPFPPLILFCFRPKNNKWWVLFLTFCYKAAVVTYFHPLVFRADFFYTRTSPLVTFLLVRICLVKYLILAFQGNWLMTSLIQNMRHR